MYDPNQLQYSIGDEDNRLEWRLLHRDASHAVSVAGSGARLLPMLARQPRRLSMLSLSPVQRALTQLRLAGLAAWTHEIYCAFFGYAPHSMIPAERQVRFEALPMPEGTKAMLRPIFVNQGWEPLAYYGQFERSVIRTSRLMRVLLGSTIGALFEAQGIEEQRQLLRERFDVRRWQLALSLLSNDDELRTELSHGAFPLRADKDAAYAHFEGVFRHLFQHTLVRESFFLQLLLFGHIEYPEGLPAEAHPLIFQAARSALDHTELDFVGDDIPEWLRAQRTIDFVSVSHLSAAGMPKIALLDLVHGVLRPGSRVVMRGRPHEARVRTVGYRVDHDTYRSLLDAEATQLWKVQVYERKFAA